MFNMQIPTSITSLYDKTNSVIPMGSLVSEFLGKANIGIPLFYGSIYNRNTETAIPFLLPESVSWSHGANYNSIAIEGRSHSLEYYTGGSSPDLTFTVEIYDDFYNMMLRKGMLNTPFSQWLNSAAMLYKGSSLEAVGRAIRALSYPKYVNGLPRPTEAIVNLGASNRYQVLITSVSQNMDGITGLNNNLSLDYRHASYNISCTVIRQLGITNNSPSATEVESGVGNEGAGVAESLTEKVRSSIMNRIGDLF